MSERLELGNGSMEARLGQVADEFTDRVNRGERPEVEDYARRYPEMAAVLRQVLPALQVMGPGSAPLEPGGAEAVSEVLVSGCLGDFRIIRKVGRGGMGVVYEAEQISLGRRVALKVLPLAAALDGKQLQRFQNEARAAAGLHHTNIVPVFSVGCERGVHYYAMQFIDGRPLSDLILQLRQAEQGQRGGPRPEEAPASQDRATAYQAAPREDTPAGATVRAAGNETPLTSEGRLGREYYRRVAELGAQAAEALDHAHQLGIVHRDVKPANLLLGPDGRLWVADFGLAQVRQGEAGLTLTGDLVGTLRYMSPEQALGQRGLVDHRTDVYSLGVTLYELLTLEPAFGGQDRRELPRQIASEEPRPPRRLDKAIPAELETIVLKALEKEPARRYATAQELADDLRRFLEDRPIQARRPTLLQRARKWSRRHQALVGAIAACLLVLITALGGSVGWVASDRAARHRQLGNDIDRALQDATRQIDAGNWPAVRQTLLRAQSLSAAGFDEGPLRQQIAALWAELQLVTRLEEIRSDVPVSSEGWSFDFKTTEEQYAQAFREHGIDVDVLPLEEAAAAIRRKRSHKELTAALEDWVRVRRAIGHPGWDRLLRIVADVHRKDDPWQERLRQTLEEGKSQALLELVAGAEHQDLSPGAVILLAGAVKTACKPSQKAASGRSAAEIVVGLLLKAQQDHPDDFWINLELGYYLQHSRPPRLEGAIRYYLVALALRPHSPTARVNLGAVFYDQGKYDEALAVFGKARDLAPGLAMVHFNLGQALRVKGRWDEAIREYREAVRLGASNPNVRYNLATALAERGQSAEAEALYREAIRLDPSDYRCHTNLSGLLEKRGELRGAEDLLRQALRIKPDEAILHRDLGHILNAQKRSKEAERELRQAIRLKSDDGEAHMKLGYALAHQGRLPEALKEYQQAAQFRPKDPLPHFNLGDTLRDLGKFSEAEEELRKALQLKPDLAEAHYNLGLVYQHQNRLSAAESEYREAVKLNPADPEGHCNLGHVLQNQGRFADALAHLRRGHELGSRRPGWPYPSAEWAQNCERLVELDGKLPEVLSGHRKPADVGERIAFAGLCQQPFQKRYAAAARFYDEAFTEKPQLAEDLNTQHRYNAARAAALAGGRQGAGADKLDTHERARLRQQALDWLRADLKAYRQVLEKSQGKAGPAIAERMQHWLQDNDFAGVRGADVLARLPKGERQEWEKLWQESEALRQRAAQRPTAASSARP
jgi:serine/threonine protein kinase/Flp pilus assembly protein TadD